LSGEIWHEEPWNRIKEGAVRNLLQRMLEVNPAKRITLDQIAQNDWFTMWVLPAVEVPRVSRAR